MIETIARVIVFLFWPVWKVCMFCAKFHVIEVKAKRKGVVERFLEKYSIPYTLTTAVTDDGYSITMQHISPLNGKNSKGACIFLHGMFESSAMTLTHADESIPILLAKQGYDVYLGNVRGNMYGLKHKSKSPWSNDFWNFSMREHAASDFPAMIEQILKDTGFKKVTAAYGTSQGGLVSLMGVAKNPHLNDKINLIVAIAPALVLRKPDNPLVKFVMNSDATLLGDFQYLSFASFTQILVPDFLACFGAFTCLAASGMSVRKQDREGAAFVMPSTPSGFLPTHSMRLYQEMLRKGEAFFNGGKEAECDFKKIKVPIGVWMGAEECVLDVDESMDLLNKNCEVVKSVILQGYGHCDLWYSVDSKNDVTPEVLKLIGKYADSEKEHGGGGGRGRSPAPQSQGSRARTKSQTKDK